MKNKEVLISCFFEKNQILSLLNFQFGKALSPAGDNNE